MKRICTILAGVFALCGLLVPYTTAKYTTQTRYTIDVITSPPSYSSWNFLYAYAAQQFKPPQDGYYAVQLWGAEGGDGYSVSGEGGKGGAGAYVAGYIWMETTDLVYLQIGTSGAAGTATTGGGGGNNGGAEGSQEAGSWGGGGGGGGGAGDLRIGGTGLDNRVMVAGGGGGGGVSRTSAVGGAGGMGGSDTVTQSTNGAEITGFFKPGQSGGQGSSPVNTGGEGGTADNGGRGGDGEGILTGTAGKDGTKGRGGDGAGLGGGGGGGYYGGGGGGGDGLLGTLAEPGGGGGGSSFISASVGDGSQIPAAVWGILPHRSDFMDPYPRWAYGVITYIGTGLPPVSADAETFAWTEDADEGLWYIYEEDTIEPEEPWQEEEQEPLEPEAWIQEPEEIEGVQDEAIAPDETETMPPGELVDDLQMEARPEETGE